MGFLRKTTSRHRKKPYACRLLYITACLLACVLCLQTAAETFADTGHSEVASGKEVASAAKIGKYGMLPVYGRDVLDGTYEVDTECSSAFFRITDAALTVKDGEMSAVITISSHSYLFVYMGTGEEAAAAPEADYIPFEDDADGRCTFTIPVRALNTELKCAAFSKNRSKWYDRLILFDASSVPADCLLVQLPDYDLIEDGLEALGTDPKELAEQQAAAEKTEEDAAEPKEAMKVDLPDGEYSIEVNMTGGSGRASISSPTLLIVKDGRAYARLIWSSSYYDYMLVGGEKYLNETTDGGNSVFTIPVLMMDEEMPAVGDTTAMGDPVEIDYSLNFYRDTIGEKGLIPQEAAKKVLIAALIIIIAGGVLNIVIKRRRQR